MKLTRILNAIVIVLSLLLASPAAPARAGLDYNQWIPFQDDFDACTGERVLVSGSQHITGHVVTDASGQKHFIFTRNLRGTGLGYTSGASYILVDSLYQSSQELPGGELKSLSQEYHSRLIRRGEGVPSDDTLIHFLTRIGFDANGNLVTEIDIQDVTCG